MTIFHFVLRVYKIKRHYPRYFSDMGVQWVFEPWLGFWFGRVRGAESARCVSGRSLGAS